jgi:hypothetical protein
VILHLPPQVNLPPSELPHAAPPQRCFLSASGWPRAQRSSPVLPPSSSGWATGAAPGQPLLGLLHSPLASKPSRFTPPHIIFPNRAVLSHVLSLLTFSCLATREAATEPRAGLWAPASCSLPFKHCLEGC